MTGEPKMNINWTVISVVVAIIIPISLYLLSRKKSDRDMIDELKNEVLKIVGTAQGEALWKRSMAFFMQQTGMVYFIHLSLLFPKKYQKKKWVNLLPVALQELKSEGHESKITFS